MCNDRVASRLLLFRVYLGLLATFWVSWLKQSIWLASVPVDQILQRKTCRFTRNFTEFSLLFFSEKVLLIFTGRYCPKASHGVGPRWWPRTATRKHERRVFSRMLQDGFRAQGGRNQTDAHSIPLIVQVGFVWRRKLTAGPTQINYSGNCSRLFIARHSALTVCTTKFRIVCSKTQLTAEMGPHSESTPLPSSYWNYENNSFVFNGIILYRRLDQMKQTKNWLVTIKFPFSDFHDMKLMSKKKFHLKFQQFPVHCADSSAVHHNFTQFSLCFWDCPSGSGCSSSESLLLSLLGLTWRWPDVVATSGNHGWQLKKMNQLLLILEHQVLPVGPADHLGHTHRKCQSVDDLFE